MGRWLLLLLCVLSWSRAVVAETPGATFDREKLERTRALVASSDQHDGAPVNVVTTTPNESPVSITRMAQGLCFVLMVLFVGVHLYKKKYGIKGVASQRRMKVIERMTVSSRCMLALVECDGKQFLIATGSDSVAFGPEQRASSFEQALSAQESAPGESPIPLHRQVVCEVQPPMQRSAEL